jgi:lipoprotein LprG
MNYQSYCRLLLGVVACLLLAGCGIAPGGEAEPTTAPTATPTPRALIEQIMQATQDTDSMHFVIDFAGAPVYADPETRRFALIGVEGDLQRPDAALASIRVRGGGAIAIVRLVSIDEQVYATNPVTREWQCFPPGALFDPVVLFDPQQGIDQLILEHITDIELIGIEDLEETDTPHYHLRGTIAGEPLSEISYGLLGAGPVQVDLWADTETQRATQIVLVDTATSEDNPSTWTLTLSDYNEEVDVRAPIECPS